jgi:hypothetical protein
MDIRAEIMTTTATTRRHVFLILLIFALLLPLNDSFLVGSSARFLTLPSAHPFSFFLVTERSHHRSIAVTSVLRNGNAPSVSEESGDIDTASRDSDGSDTDSDHTKTLLACAYNVAKIASALAWTATAYIALSFHPDPRFKDCTLRHNILTMSQAYAFPLPVLCACFDALRISAKKGKLQSATARHLSLAVSVASFWLAAAMAFAPQFSFGYDLYGPSHKVVTTTVHALSGLFTMGVLLLSSTPGQIFRELVDSLWKLGPKKSKSSGTDSFVKNSSLLATSSIGLLWFTVLPIVSPYPLATIPTILGKRLSRPASAFTLLGSVMAYCLKEGIDSVPTTACTSQSTHKGDSNDDDLSRILNRGLAIGSGSHLLLIALKLIGVDGGGWIFPGRGLWEVYPAMMSVPFATGVSMLIHAVLCLATSS